MDRELTIGSIWRHYKGGEYEIVTTALIESDKTECVVYRSLKDGIVWVRPKNSFLEVISSDGGTHFYRFERVGNFSFGRE